MSKSEYPRKFTFMVNDHEETVEFKTEKQLRRFLDKRLGKRSPFHDLLLPPRTRKSGARN